MNRFQKFSDSILNTAVWGLRGTHGTSFFMEFGSPWEEVRKSIAPKEPISEKVREILGKKRTIIHGFYNLLVTGSYQLLFSDKKISSELSDAPELEAALKEFNDCKLIQIETPFHKEGILFAFEKNMKMQIFKNQSLEDDELLIFSEKDNFTCSLLANGDIDCDQI